MRVRSSTSASERGAPSVFSRHVFLPCVFAHSLSRHLINVKYGFRTVAGEEEGDRRRLLLQYLSPACIFKRKGGWPRQRARARSRACMFNVSCRVLQPGRPGDVSQDGVRLRQPQRRPVLLPRVRPATQQPVSAPERPAHLRQRRHVGGELPAVPVPGKY